MLSREGFVFGSGRRLFGDALQADPPAAPPQADALAAIQERIRAVQRVKANGGIDVPDPEGTAQAIHAAAARAKSPTDADPAPPMNPLSKAIVDAGRKRRGEVDR